MQDRLTRLLAGLRHDEGTQAIAAVTVLVGATSLATAWALGQTSAFLIGVLLLAVAAGLYLMLRLDPAWALSIGIAASVFSGYWDELGSPLPLDRVILVVGLLNLGLRQLTTGPRGTFRVRAVHWALALAAIWATSSAIWTESIGDSTGFFGLLDRFGLVPFLMFAIGPLAFATEPQRQILLGVLVALGAYLSVTALFEALGADALVVPAYIADENVGIHSDRSRGPFAEASANGLALFACGIAAMVALSKWTQPLLRLGAMSVVVLSAAGILFTLTRSAWAGGIAGAAVALTAFAPLRRYLVPAAMALAILITSALAFVPGLVQGVEERRSENRSVWDRYNSNNAAVRMVLERPLIGFGWNSFPTRGDAFYRQGDDYPLTEVRYVHNIYLSVAAELGIIGAGLWLAAFLLAIGAAAVSRAPPELAPWRMGLVAIAVQYVMVAALVPLAQVFPTLLLWTWAGVVYAPRVLDASDRGVPGWRYAPATA